MSLFGKKEKKLPADTFALMPELEAEEPPVNYNSVVEWLVGLGDSDLEKVNKVVDINRKAYADTCAVLEVPNEPSTFITPPEPPTVADSSFTNDDGEIDFLDDEAPAKPKSKGRKVTVKDDPKS